MTPTPSDGDRALSRRSARPAKPPILGIDLAWGERNASGAAVLVEQDGVPRTAQSALLGGDDEILAFVDRHRGAGAAIVAIDALLIAPKKGCVAERRAGLTTLQDLIHARLSTHPAVRIEPFSKEDPGAFKGRA